MSTITVPEVPVTPGLGVDAPPDTIVVEVEAPPDTIPVVDTPTFEACGADPGYVCERVEEWTGNELLADTAQLLVGQLLPVLLILAGAMLANRLIGRVIQTMVARLTTDIRDRADAARASVDTAELPELKARAIRELEAEKLAEIRAAQRAETLGTVLRSIMTIVIGAVAVVMVIGEFGVSIGPLLAGAGIIGVALGFGAQSLVKDFLTGMFMLAEDQYAVGDVVDLGEAVGAVEEVQLRITKVRALDGTLWFVPNGEIHRVANKTKLWSRVVLDVAVAYDTDLDRAGEVILDTAREVWRTDPRIHEEPELWGVETFGADSIAIRVALRVDAGQQWAIAREVRKLLKAALDAAGIVIPFPQRVVWMRTEGDGPRPVDGVDPVAGAISASAAADSP